jgi:hypothetical protein
MSLERKLQRQRQKDAIKKVEAWVLGKNRKDRRRKMQTRRNEAIAQGLNAHDEHFKQQQKGPLTGRLSSAAPNPDSAGPTSMVVIDRKAQIDDPSLITEVQHEQV